MKLKALIILLISLLGVYSLVCRITFDDLVDYYRINTNYRGSIWFKNQLYVYGDYGIINKTNDFCQTWERVQLNEDANIIGMVTNGKTLFGVLEKDYIIISEDGISWGKKYLGSYTFKNVILKRSEIICLADSNLIILDLEGNVIKTIPVQQQVSSNELSAIDDNVYVVIDKGKFQGIDTKSGTRRDYDLQDYGLCTDCGIPMNFVSENNNLYFKVGKDIYKFNGSNFELLGSTTLSGIIGTYGNEIYFLFSRPDPITNEDKIYFYKLNKTTKKFEAFSQKGSDRYLVKLNLTNLNFVSKDTLVVTGKENFIAVSTDGGVNWKVISTLPKPLFNIQIIRLNQKDAIWVNLYFQFLKSSNGGLTWLPQKNYNSIYDKLRHRYFPYFDTVKSGFTFSPDFEVDAINFCYTDDSCETLKFKNVNELIGYSCNSVDYIKSFDKILMFFNGYYKKNNYTLIFKLNQSLDYSGQVYFDSTKTEYVFSYGDTLFALCRNMSSKGNFLFLLSSSDTGNTWVNRYQFDTNKLKFAYGFLFHYPFIITHDFDPLDDSAAVIYVFDLRNMTLTRILSVPKGELYSFVDINGNIILLFYDPKGTDPKQFNFYGYIWEDFTSDKIKIHRLPMDKFENKAVSFQPQKNPETLYFVELTFDSTKGDGLYFGKPKSKPSPVEVEPSVPDFYLSTAEHIGSNRVRFRFWWSQIFLPEKFKFQIFDILGKFLGADNLIYFKQINNYSGEILINTETLSSGVYLLTIFTVGQKLSRAFVVF